MPLTHTFDSKRQTVLQTPDLLAFWDFQNADFVSVAPDRTRLQSVREAPRLESGGVFGPLCARFRSRGQESRGFLRAAYADAPQLSIGGAGAQFSVVAWLRRAPRPAGEYDGCQFVAGVWNEHGRRQYGMFLNLGIWNSADQVGAHVSSHGGATPGHPYCMDAAIGATAVDCEGWHCAAISYDGQRARVFLDGVLDVREPQGEPGRNPFDYPAGLLKGDADFTVGAVPRPANVVRNDDGSFGEVGALLANPFVGVLGGLAIYARALDTGEMRALARLCRIERSNLTTQW